VDSGETWEEITPEIRAGLILEVNFYDVAQGWAVVLQAEADREAVLIYQTDDGGKSWTVSSRMAMGEAASDLTGIAGAHLDFLDKQIGFLVLNQQSGSSFSKGWLFATKDGGMTWEERRAPLGEAVVFRDPQEGWMTGGATQDRIYHTRDGGRSWEIQRLTELPEGKAFVGKVQFDPLGKGILPVTVLGEEESSLVLYRIEGGSGSWVRSEMTSLPTDYEPGAALPFSQRNGSWWSGIPSSSRLYRSETEEQRAIPLSPSGLPAGLVSLDFVNEEAGLALVQEGRCYGDKAAATRNNSGNNHFYCIQEMRIFKTVDGGNSWQEIWVD
jgi:hypothetical protein